MNIISLETNSKNSFHRIQEETTHTEGGFVFGNSIITGHSLETIESGDVLKLYGIDHVVISVIKRNHRGIFKNPDHAINSFFEAHCTYKKVIK